MSENDRWLDLVQLVLDQHRGKGGFEVLFPSYRPDMSKALAHHLGLKFYDYRFEKMQSLGWDACNLDLKTATEQLLEESKKSGLLVHNIEGLLATKPEEERRQWLADFLKLDWSNSVVLPLAIYQGDTLEEHPRICDIELTPFAKESFIMRLAM